MINSIVSCIWSVVLNNLPVSFRTRYFFYKNYKYWPKINNPKIFNEHILKRILFDKNPRYALLADKYKVRKYISEVIGDEYLIPLISATNNPDDLLAIDDWSGVVIKPNHAAGMIKICEYNPELIDKIKIIDDAKKWLTIDFSELAGEWHYSLIKPMILMEKKITEGDLIPRDYKFHCFKQNDGSINYVLQLVDGRFGVESRGYYLNSLDNLVWYHGATNYLLDNDEKQILLTAIELNKKIISNETFNYIRIDWYIVKTQLFFGELTCTPGAGRSNEFGLELEKQMSDWWI